MPFEYCERVAPQSGSSALPSLTSKRFKMLRLRKDPSSSSSSVSTQPGPRGELGIVISKKRHPQKGTTGYVIAHIDRGGLVER